MGKIIDFISRTKIEPEEYSFTVEQWKAIFNQFDEPVRATVYLGMMLERFKDCEKTQQRITKGFQTSKLCLSIDFGG